MKCLRAFLRRLFHRQKDVPRVNSLGSNSHLPSDLDIAGGENVSIGDHVYIGPRCSFITAKARLIIGDHVMFGPEVMVITGDHRIDIPGKRLDEITDDMKLPENDRDVVIESDVWIGARALILKGVRIHSGSVIAAGAVVLEDVQPNTVYYAKGKTRPRFK